ncbi:hypothetical protein DMC30DRAFT_440325 [Rhodotorula diobovata]|uniref:Transmembrane protein n=1 Tax=Rhodotorula diobovata TaxID=5288 RepID=A0A5C5FTS3_9BASI|nr:hypothetical protein DMC30DRAFT_440325 [Rhodotorula diobovata]
MGCCCSTQSRAALGASILNLVVCACGLLVSSVLVTFRWEEISSPACAAFALATFAVGALSAVLGVLETLVSRWDHHEVTLKAATGVAAVATLLSIVYTIWSPIVMSASYHVAESRAVVVGTFVLLSVFLVVAPLAWATWAYFSLLRELQHGAGARTAMPRKTLEATQQLQQQRGDIEMSLPHGRARRGSVSSRADKGRYARVGGEEGGAWESGSEESGLSSEEEDRKWEAKRQQRKRASRA